MMKRFLTTLGFYAVVGALSVCPAPGKMPVQIPAAPALHWAQFPIRVFVSASGDARKQEAQTALTGLDEWVQASQGKVRYVIVTSPGDADITVRFEPTRFLSAQTESIGETTLTYSGSTLKKASIRLAEGIAVPEDLQAAAAHEFGHALGIQSHSADPNDLMYPCETLHVPLQEDAFPDEAHSVTAHDLQRLKACYPSWYDGTHATRRY